MASRDPKDLIPSMQLLATKFTKAMEDASIPFIFTCVCRTQEEQNKLYAQGRTEPGSVVTWTKRSNHIPRPKDKNTENEDKSYAFDIAILYQGKPNWGKETVELYQKAGEIGEELGLVWGGSWKNRDLCHFEFKED